MLKIKDNVDLKELEKFGYKQVEDTTDVSYCCYGKVFGSKDGKSLIDVVEINKNTYRIELLRSFRNDFRSFVNGDENLLNDLIEDLIKADLVEKVEN